MLGNHSVAALKEYPKPLYPDINLLGVPVFKGQSKDGTQLGPALMRDTDLIPEMAKIGVTVRDLGDLKLETIDESDEPTLFGMRRPQNFVSSTQAIADRVEKLVKYSSNGQSSTNGASELVAAGQKVTTPTPLVLVGGDHSMATGSILGHMRVHPDACVIWIDAHADLNTPMTSTSGWMHGMPLAFLMRELQEEIPHVADFDFIKPTYDIRQNSVTHFTMHDIDRLGIETVIRKAIEAVNPRLERPIHLSFDIDALDPSLAPSTGTAVPGGLSLREALRICEEVHATGKLSVLDLVELNPKIGTAQDVQTTKDNALLVLKTCLGYRRSGHLPFVVHSLKNEGIKSRKFMNEKNGST